MLLYRWDDASSINIAVKMDSWIRVFDIIRRKTKRKFDRVDGDFCKDMKDNDKGCEFSKAY